MATRMFGTDGVRGVPGEPPLDRVTILRLGVALVEELRATSAGPNAPRIVCGRDTRDSGAWIEAQFAAGIRAAGGTLVSLGVLPTPGVALITARHGFDAGVAISASHNPHPDNGIKLIAADGSKATGEVERRLEARVIAAANARGNAVAGDAVDRAVGGAPERPELLAAYDHHLAGVAGGVALRGMRVVIDCAHGATSTVAPTVLRRLGVNLITLHAEPDGCNINRASGATHPEALQAAVVAHGCQAGFAFDGDGDRVIAADAGGCRVDGDSILYLGARALRDAGRLPGDGVVATVMSNHGLEVALRDAGITLHRCGVGDATVYAEMRQRGVALGGEQSGHVILSELLPTGDGIATAITVLRVMAERQAPLADLVDGLMILPQVLLNVPVVRTPPIPEVPGLVAAVRDAEAQLGGAGRVLVRYSGTEPLLRVMIEGTDRDAVEALAARIADRARMSLT